MERISKFIADFETEYMKEEPEEAESHVYEMNLDLTDINASLHVCAQELEFRLDHLNHAVEHVDFDEARKCLKELEFFQSCYSALNEWRLGLQTAMNTGKHLAREECLKQQMQKVESNPESNPIPYFRQVDIKN